MTSEKELHARSESSCELCKSKDDLAVFPVAPSEESILICSHCKEQIEDPEKVNINHWRCLNDSMWSEHPAVQVVAWRMLTRLKDEGWPADLLDMMYLDEDTLEWAKAGVEEVGADTVKHVDSNGNVLQQGDTVTLTKDLNVKGSSLVAKRGSAVRNINLVWDNPEHIEGKVDGQTVVILTKFVKK